MKAERQPTSHAIAEDDEQPRLRAVLDMVPALVAYIDRNGIYRVNNHAYELWFGRRHEEITGHPVREILGDDAWVKIEPRLKRALAGEQVHYDDWVPYKDAGARWVSVDYTPDFDRTGEVLGVTVIARDRTEQRRMDEALRWHAEILKVAQEAIFIWRVPGGVEFWNNGAAELYGYSPDEALGRPLSELLQTQFPQPWNQIELALLSRRRWEGVIRHRTKDGRELIVHSRLQRIPNRDGAMLLLESARDVTEQTLAEGALRREHEFNATLLRTTAAVIVVLDCEGRVVHFNPALEAVTGYGFDEVQGQTFFDLFLLPDEKQSVTAVFEALRLGQGPSKHVNYIRTREGTQRLIEWSNSVLFDENSEVEFVIGTGLDITERREMEREILEIGDRERQRIGQDLHDGLGQELTALDFFNHTFLQQLRAAAPSLVNDFETMTLQLRETIRHARLLSHGLLPVPSELEGLMLALRSLARATESTAKTECRFTCNDLVLMEDADVATHLCRIAQEAVNNAVKYAHARHIDIGLRLTGSTLELTVADDGEGFAPTATWDRGIGLRIMNYRAELIGAQMRIASVPEHGVCVTCTLPQKP